MSDQVEYSLRATADDCEDEGMSDRAQLLRACATEIESLRTQLAAVTQQAQIWKQEAMTHKASLHECYQACTGATGEPGNWNGAAPVRALVAERDRMKAALETARNGLLWYQDTYPDATDGCDDEAMAEIDAAIAQTQEGA